MSTPSANKLKNTISLAEERLNKLEEDGANKNKQFKIKKSLEKAYALLNSDEYTQESVDKRTDELIKVLEYDETRGIFWIFLFGFLLSCATVFTAYETYSFIRDNLDRDHSNLLPEFNEEVSQLVQVNYKETNIVDLKDQMTVSDYVGLQNIPQEFSISNDSSKVPSLNYKIHYSVNIVELNENKDRVLEKKYIKYQLTYTDKFGKEIVKPISTFDNLEKNPDGSYLLMKGIQKKDKNTNFKVVIWLSSLAPNEMQNTSYTFIFKVKAAVTRA